ncbi:MAG: FAD-dependent oxidoreductase [Deltaproteobacteria bacterium]|nr:FAD-dependent oxidoreductase [Deltaproteobacteria bacterium]
MALRTVVVVGASLAGLRAVEALRERGFEGRLVWVGAEPHAPYDRPPLSKEILRGEWEPEAIALARGGLEAFGAERRFGVRAASLDTAGRRVVLAGGERIAFDGLVIATGAAARRLPGQPVLAGVHVLRTLGDALAIRDALAKRPRVAVVGGGFLGAEVAASCRQMGLAVAMIEALGNPLEQALGPALGGLYAGLHREHGVELVTGAPVEALEGAGRVERVRLAGGRRLDAELVVVGIGVRPETGWLEGSGLTLRDGVVCDERCRAAPGIVAAGDVARWRHPRWGELRLEHWSHAVEQARAAVGALLDGDAAPPFAPVPSVWSEQYGARLLVAGLPRAGDELRVVEGSLEERRFTALFGRAGRLTGAAAIGPARRFLPWRRALAGDLGLDEALARAGA